MDVAIQVVWAIGLLGALGATLVILKLVALILRALRHIHELMEATRVAAHGVASHLTPVPTLGTLPERARGLARAERELGGAARRLVGTTPGGTAGAPEHGAR